MVTKFVLDTSVVVKWFSSEKEQHLALAQEIFRDILNKKIVVYSPEILLLELANALLISKKIDARNTIDSCKILLKSPIIFVSPVPQLVFQAIKYASIYKMTIYDAFYVAIADNQKCKIITSDKKFAAACSNALVLENYKSPSQRN